MRAGRRTGPPWHVVSLPWGPHPSPGFRRPFLSLNPPTIPVTFRKNILFRYGNFLKCVSTRKKYVPLSPALTSVMLRLQFLAWGSLGRENRPGSPHAASVPACSWPPGDRVLYLPLHGTKTCRSFQRKPEDGERCMVGGRTGPPAWSHSAAVPGAALGVLGRGRKSAWSSSASPQCVCVCVGVGVFPVPLGPLTSPQH